MQEHSSTNRITIPSIEVSISSASPTFPRGKVVIEHTYRINRFHITRRQFNSTDKHHQNEEVKSENSTQYNLHSVSNDTKNKAKRLFSIHVEPVSTKNGSDQEDLLIFD